LFSNEWTQSATKRGWFETADQISCEPSLIAVLPPTLLVVPWAEGLVGIWTNPQPRLTIAAANPGEITAYAAA